MCTEEARLLERGWVRCAGASNPIGWRLADQHVQVLDAASHVPPPYPHDFVAHVARDRR